MGKLSRYLSLMAKLRIDEMRRKAGISKREFARRMRIEEKNAPRYFKSDYNPRFDTLVKIAKAFRVKIRDLIRE